MENNNWIGVPDNIKDYVGFVYIISNTVNYKYYIGQKKFWSNKTLKPLKGKTRKRHITKESDWKDYWGSSKELLDDIKKYGKENFIRNILECFKYKALMNYEETKLQFYHDVLRDPTSYNKIINCRISANQLPK